MRTRLPGPTQVPLPALGFGQMTSEGLANSSVKRTENVNSEPCKTNTILPTGPNLLKSTLLLGLHVSCWYPHADKVG